MRIGIVETGAPPASIEHRFGRYPAMFERLLAPLLPRASFTAVPVFEGAPPPALAEFDAFLITGSPAGVYEGHAWIAPLERFIREAAAARRPQVGICFGHQAMAKAFGGKVEKSTRGWGVGVHHYEIEAQAPFMQPFQARIACAVSHQDQVVEPPEGARRLGGSAFCPNGLLAYAQGPAISMQPHPEFEHEFAAALLAARADRIPAPVADEARSSFARRSDRALLAQWIAQFLQSERT